MTMLQKVLTFQQPVWVSYIIILMVQTKLFLNLFFRRKQHVFFMYFQKF